MAKLWISASPEPPPEYLYRRQRAILETAWACILATMGIMVTEPALPSTDADAHPVDIAANAQRSRTTSRDSSPQRSLSSRATPLSVTSDSQLSGTSWTGTSNSAPAEDSERPDPALKRLRFLATSIIEEDRASKAPQHPVLSRWPEKRGVPIAGYVSTIVEAQFKKSEAARERTRRREERRARRAKKFESLRGVQRDSPGFRTDPVRGPHSSQADVVLPRRMNEPQSGPGHASVADLSSVALRPGRPERYLSPAESGQPSSQRWNQSLFSSQPAAASKKSSKKKPRSGFR